MAGGQPPKLDDLVERRICDALKRGHSWAAAARAGGISERALHLWRERGEREGEGRYFQFMQRVNAADHMAENRAIEILASKFDSSDERVALSAVQWWLERRRPAEWGKRDNVQTQEPLLTEDEAKEKYEKLTGHKWTGT